MSPQKIICGRSESGIPRALKLDLVLFNDRPVYLNAYAGLHGHFDEAVLHGAGPVDQVEPERVAGLVVLEHGFYWLQAERSRRKGRYELQGGCKADAAAPYVRDQRSVISLREGGQLSAFGEASGGAQIGLVDVGSPGLW